MQTFVQLFLFVFASFGPEHSQMLFGAVGRSQLYFRVLFQLFAEHGKHLFLVACENSFLAVLWQGFVYVVPEDTMPLERLKYMFQVCGKEVCGLSKHGGAFAHIADCCRTSATQLACDSGIERRFAVQFLNPIYGIFVPCFRAGCVFHVNDCLFD
jgi:hypothetical protein